MAQIIWFTEPNNYDAVLTSSPDYNFQAQFTALYVKPGATNTHYAAEALTLPVESPNWKIHDINKKYHFGFDLFFKAPIHKVNSALFINWEHFKSCDTAGAVTDSDNMLGPFFEIGPDASPYFKAAGIVKFNFNEINLDYGQNIDIGDHLTTNIFAGISFVKICETLDYTYSGIETSQAVSRNILTPTRFKGVGPQAGISFLYDIVHGLGIAGKLSGSLLSGKSYNHTTYTSNSPFATTDPNIQTTTTNCLSLMVPSLFQRIGLTYGYNFRDHYEIRAEIGYQAQVYFNALQTVDMGSEVVSPPVSSSSIGVYARTFQRNISNFTLSGAYFTFAVGF